MPHLLASSAITFVSPAVALDINLAQIAGYALSNILLDALAVDVERLQCINSTFALLTPGASAATSLKPIEVLVIAPSQRLDDIARNASVICRSRSARCFAASACGAAATARTARR